MEVMHTHCAGLDVHKDTVVACARRIIDKGRADRVLALVENLETLPDIREILDLLRDPSPGL